MTLRVICSAMFVFLFLSPVLFVSSASSEDRPVLEQNKTEIIEDIESLVQGLHKTRDCVTEAKTEADFNRCPESIKIRRFQELQNKLNELGMTREERKMEKSPREY